MFFGYIVSVVGNVVTGEPVFVAVEGDGVHTVTGGKGPFITDGIWVLDDVKSEQKTWSSQP